MGLINVLSLDNCFAWATKGCSYESDETKTEVSAVPQAERNVVDASRVDLPPIVIHINRNNPVGSKGVDKPGMVDEAIFKYFVY